MQDSVQVTTNKSLGISAECSNEPAQVQTIPPCPQVQPAEREKPGSNPNGTHSTPDQHVSAPSQSCDADPSTNDPPAVTSSESPSSMSPRSRKRWQVRMQDDCLRIMEDDVFSDVTFLIQVRMNFCHVYNVKIRSINIVR